MPNSCKSIIKRLRHNGAITQAEFDKLMRKLDGWIPVTERLPEDGQKVLWQCRSGSYDVFRWYDDYWWTDSGMCGLPSFVVAWMPLPEPYVPDICVGELESQTGAESEVDG